MRSFDLITRPMIQSSFSRHNKEKPREATLYQPIKLTITNRIQPIFKLNQTKGYDLSGLVSYRDNTRVFLPRLPSASAFYDIKLLYK